MAIISTVSKIKAPNYFWDDITSTEINWSMGQNIYRVYSSQPIDLTFSNIPSFNQEIILNIKNTAVTPITLTFPISVIWVSGENSISLDAGQETVISFKTNSGAVLGINYNLYPGLKQQQVISSVYDNGVSGTINFNNGVTQKVSLSGNLTLTFANAIAGRVYVIRLLHTVASSKVITWPVAVKWSRGIAPFYSTTLNAVDVISFFYDGTTFYGNGVVGY